MPEFQIRVTQVFRVEKHIILSVEADTEEEAIRLVDEREIDVPTADDDLNGDWSVGGWLLQNEEVEAE